MLYRGEDEALLSGEPGAETAKDYAAFPNASTDGKWLVFMYGQGHNNPPGANTIALMDLSTKEVQTLVDATGDDNFRPTNPWIIVLTQGANAGRIIVGWTDLDTREGANIRRMMTINSDDDGETWTEPDLFTDLQDEDGSHEFGHIDGPGNPIEYEGILLKACYGLANGEVGGRRGYLFKNETGGTGRWEYVNLIWGQSSTNGEEPCIAYNGEFIMCTQRSDPNQKVELFKLADLNSSWTGPYDPGFPSVGKTPIVWDGEMWVMLGRKSGANGRPFYTYTTDPTGETGWVEGIDLSQRITSYMYGDIVIKEGGFDFYWAQGVFGEPTPGISGPTIIYKKNMIKSIVEVAPPTTYNEYYRMDLDYVQGFNIIIPGTSDLRALHNQLIEDLTDDGIWDGVVVALIFQHNDTDLSAFSLFNLKNPHRRPTPTAHNAPTYAVDGYDFNGVDQYINTRFIPFSHGDGIYTLNDAGVFIRIWDDVTGSGLADFGGSNGNFQTAVFGPNLNSRSGTGAAGFSINDSTGSSVAVATSVGRHFLQRVDEESNQKRLWKDGALIHQDTVAAAGLCVKEITVGARNYNNQVGQFSPRKVGYIFFTSSLTGLEAQLDARMAQYEQDVMSL